MPSNNTLVAMVKKIQILEYAYPTLQNHEGRSGVYVAYNSVEALFARWATDSSFLWSDMVVEFGTCEHSDGGCFEDIFNDALKAFLSPELNALVQYAGIKNDDDLCGLTLALIQREFFDNSVTLSDRVKESLKFIPLSTSVVEFLLAKCPLSDDELADLEAAAAII